MIKLDANTKAVNDVTTPLEGELRYIKDGIFLAVGDGRTVSGKQLPTLTTGTTVPAITPTAVGLFYLDTVTKILYVSTGIASDADWEPVAGGAGDGDTLGDLTPSLGHFVVGDGAVWITEDAAAARTSLGLGTMAVEAAADYLTIADATITYQPLDSDLTTIGGLVKTDGNFIVADGAAWTVESGATARSSLGLGTMALETAANYLTTAAASATYLTIASAASTYQPLDTQLTDIAALAVTDGGFIVGNGTTFVLETAGTARDSIGLGVFNTVQFASINIGHGSDTTLSRVSAGDLQIEANIIYRAGGTDVPVTDGGTGSSTAAGAATNLGLGTGDSPQFTAVNIGHATDTTLSRVGAGDLQIESNIIYRAGGTDVPLTDGGTGASTASGALTNLGINNTYTRQRVYTAGATWNKPTATNFVGVIVIAVGPGGGGGGSSNTNARVGAGGGGGGWCYKNIVAASLNNTETITVGTGGTGGTATGAGNPGTSTSTFGAHVTAGLGSGGLAGNGAATNTTGGTASGGDFNYDGALGAQPGLWTDTYRGHGGGAGGAQSAGFEIYLTNLGVAPLWAGQGGRGISGTEAVGRHGMWPGGGGGGGGRNATTSRVGGNGANGAVIVYELYGT